jgi:hypothetical protein
MPRPWQRIVVQEDLGVIEVFAGRGMFPGLNVAMSDEDVEATRLGYKCIQCFENFDEGWPETCFVCGFPVRDEQAEKFAKAFKGHEPGARTGADWEAEADRIEDRAERRAFELRAKKSGISLGLKGVLIPKGLRR